MTIHVAGAWWAACQASLLVWVVVLAVDAVIRARKHYWEKELAKHTARLLDHDGAGEDEVARSLERALRRRRTAVGIPSERGRP